MCPSPMGRGEGRWTRRARGRPLQAHMYTLDVPHAHTHTHAANKYTRDHAFSTMHTFHLDNTRHHARAQVRPLRSGAPRSRAACADGTHVQPTGACGVCVCVCVGGYFHSHPKISHVLKSTRKTLRKDSVCDAAKRRFADVCGGKGSRLSAGAHDVMLRRSALHALVPCPCTRPASPQSPGSRPTLAMMTRRAACPNPPPLPCSPARALLCPTTGEPGAVGADTEVSGRGPKPAAPAAIRPHALLGRSDQGIARAGGGEGGRRRGRGGRGRGKKEGVGRRWWTCDGTGFRSQVVDSRSRLAAEQPRQDCERR